jgi:hypothetical protein
VNPAIEPAPGAAPDAAGPAAARGEGGVAGRTTVHAFGVEYTHVRPPAGGDLFVTRFGLPVLDALMPERWYDGQWYETNGERLTGATGQVYRVRPRPGPGRAPELVVKFSRVAQDVPIVAEATFPRDADPGLFVEARFNSPMEEFGLLNELREGAFEPAAARVPTQLPLAIFAPPEAYDLWQMGRSSSTFHSHNALLAEEQGDEPKAIEMDIRRIYVVLYGWLHGNDAEAAFLAGNLAEDEFLALAPRVTADLARRGFRVLDNKPKHYILRPRAGGGFLRRHDGALVYGLVDFELLQRSEEHQSRYRSARRVRYWQMQGRTAAKPVAAPRSHLRPVSVFGVDYLCGPTPDGGRLWVVGREEGLFDYFLPDRWRRTPRVKLSVTGEVYRTGTRDHVDIVYRRSRVGFRPRVDPLIPASRGIRESGYNSPFEEFAIAERLREMGVRTTWPRAIFHTGHETAQAPRLRDARRFAEHSRFAVPGEPPEPVLLDGRDYYTIWDAFRGADPPRGVGRDAACGGIALLRARDDGLITSDEADEALARVRERLRVRGLPADGLAGEECVVTFDLHGEPQREPGGGLRLHFSLDALTAFEYGLLEEPAYLGLVSRSDEALRRVDFQKLDPGGRHLMLSLDSEGKLELEPSGDIRTTLCNFSLIRGLYRPLR